MSISYLEITPADALELAKVMTSSTTHDELVQGAQRVAAKGAPDDGYEYVKITDRLRVRIGKLPA